MSTVKCTNLQQASSASPNITLDASTNATVAGTLAMGSSFKRNRIINGNMQVWQRGTSGFASSGIVYAADRWFTVNSASAVAQSSDVPSTDFQYSISYASSTATFPYVAQRIEDINIRDLASKTVTFSFWAKNSSGASNLYIEAYYPTAVNNYTSVTNIFSQQLALSPSSSWTYYTYSYTLPANVVNGLEFRIIRNNVAAATTLVTGVQLEVGSVATPYERQIYSDQLAQCQRYAYVLTGTGAYRFFSQGWNQGTTLGRSAIILPVTMRSAPTGTFSAANTFLWQSAGINYTPTAIGVALSSTSAYLVDATVSGATNGYSGVLLDNASTAAIATLSAEL